MHARPRRRAKAKGEESSSYSFPPPFLLLLSLRESVIVTRVLHASISISLLFYAPGRKPHFHRANRFDRPDSDERGNDRGYGVIVLIEDDRGDLSLSIYIFI